MIWREFFGVTTELGGSKWLFQLREFSGSEKVEPLSYCWNPWTNGQFRVLTYSVYIIGIKSFNFGNAGCTSKKEKVFWASKLPHEKTDKNNNFDMKIMGPKDGTSTIQLCAIENLRPGNQFLDFQLDHS